MLDHTAIRVSGLKKRFGDGDTAVTAVDDVSFRVEAGSVVGLLGPNGAGKTTTIKSMLGLVTPDEGTVEVFGADIHEHPHRANDRIGAIMEGARNTYWRLTVRENLSFFAGLGGEDPANVRERHEELLELIGLDEKSDTPVNELSRGMKQKVSIASTLARDVDIVFMDEPTLGLDVEASRELRSELRRLADTEDLTVVLTSHDMDVIEAVCDRVLILQNGSITIDDEVGVLLDFLGVKQYRVTVALPFNDALRHEIERSFDVEIHEDGGCLHIDLTVTEVDTVYELLTRIKSEGESVTDLQSIDPDLEDVFLRLVGSDEPPSTDDTRTTSDTDGGTDTMSTANEGVSVHED